MISVGRLALLSTVPASGFTDPSSLTDLLGWWKDGGSDTVSQWNDASGNGRHFTQATSADQPTRTTTLNGKNVYSFPTGGDGMEMSNATDVVTDDTLSMTMVLRNNDADGWGEARFWSCRTSGGEDYTGATGFYTGIFNGSGAAGNPMVNRNGVRCGMPHYTTQYLATWYIFTVVFDGSVMRTFIGGVETSSITGSHGTGTSSVASTGNFNIDQVRLGWTVSLSFGATTDHGLLGDIAEVVFWGSAVTGDRTNVENYLYNKWFVAAATGAVDGPLVYTQAAIQRASQW
jgi:hypothetical protein